MSAQLNNIPQLNKLPQFSNENYYPTRVFHRTQFALKSELGSEPRTGDLAPNWLEKMGDFGLYIPSRLPNVTLNAIRDPRIVTLFLTVISLAANSYLFYPTNTLQIMKDGLEVLQLIQPESIKFAAYLFSCNIILSLGCRAGGRFSNEALYNAFTSKV